MNERTRADQRDSSASPAALAHTSLETGLTEAEVAERRELHGYNEIPDQEEAFLRRLLRRLWGPIPGMIEVAALLSAILQKWEDFAIISVLLLVNVVIDFRQESRALGALRVLKDKLARTAFALRGGRWARIEARLLVPGDVIKLRLGDVVPADVELVEGEYLQLDQAALTGESLPVNRAAGDEAYANAVVKLGEMTGVVSATGPNSFFGRTVSLVARAEREQRSHFQRAVVHVGHYLIVLAVILVFLVVVVGLVRHDPAMELLRFALVLTVASVPVALPAVLSVTMAVGAMRLARRQAIVSRLVAIEELAGVDILCSDKTGTLTQNRMQLGEPVVFAAWTPAQALAWAALASRRDGGDPLEEPIFSALGAENASPIGDGYEVTHFVPFDPVRKRTEAEVRRGAETWTITKGAAQTVMSLCPGDPNLEAADRTTAEFAKRGYRTLAVALKPGTAPAFQLVGLLPFFDPPREDSAETLQRARELGIDVKMLTGDNLAIAREVAEKLGITRPIGRATELHDHAQEPEEVRLLADVLSEALLEELRPGSAAEDIAALKERVHARLVEKIESKGPKAAFLRRHESELIDHIEAAGGFAEVFPEDKYKIIEKLQRRGHIVAMTGDGVNDAPALKRADAGIAVSGATDAARAAADIVLLHPGLSVIVYAIEEARQIFARMKSYAIFRIAETIRVILFMALAIMVFDFYPVTAVMIIVLALLNDIPILAIAYDNTSVDPRPVRWDMGEVLTVATVLGLLGVASSFLLFFGLVKFDLPAPLIQAIVFLKLDVAGHSTLYVARTGEHHFWHRPYPAKRLFLAIFSTRIAGTLIAVYGVFMAPVGWEVAAYVWLYATVWFLINDYVKVWTYKLIRRRRKLQAERPGPVRD